MAIRLSMLATSRWTWQPPGRRSGAAVVARAGKNHTLEFGSACARSIVKKALPRKGSWELVSVGTPFAPGHPEPATVTEGRPPEDAVIVRHMYAPRSANCGQLRACGDETCQQRGIDESCAPLFEEQTPLHPKLDALA